MSYSACGIIILLLDGLALDFLKYFTDKSMESKSI